MLYITHSPLGRHNCLWCTIRNTELRIPLHVHGRSPARSVESIQNDYQRFVDDGSQLRRAKEFNNAIGEPFFSIPLDQVNYFNSTKANTLQNSF